MIKKKKKVPLFSYKKACPSDLTRVSLLTDVFHPCVHQDGEGWRESVDCVGPLSGRPPRQGESLISRSQQSFDIWDNVRNSNSNMYIQNL